MLLLHGGNHYHCPNKPCAVSVQQAFPVKSGLPHLSDVIDEEFSRNRKGPAPQKALLEFIIVGTNQHLHMASAA